MAPSLRSPTDPLPDTSRRVHHHTRFPSLTEFPDSPSVYSHAYHSPNVDAHFDTPSFSHLSDSPRCTESDDETASTVRSLSTEDVRDDCDDDASHFLSLQGPKIRFHSRAPWETDDDSPHVEEPDDHARLGMFGNKLKGKTSKTDNLIRTFTRGPSIGGRPSVDSARSQISATSSFEVTAGNYSSSRGALYDLARQSMSTASLTSSSASVRSQNFARTTNYPKSSLYNAHDSLARAVSLDGMVPPSTTLERRPVHYSSFDAVRVGREGGARPSPSSTRLLQERRSHDQFVHPYANPDLVAYTPSPETIPSHHSNLGDMVGCDSNSTVTDSTSNRSAAFSDTSTDTSTTSLTSRDGPHVNLRVNGKEISPPISVLRQGDASYVDRSTKFLSLHPPPTGFEGPIRSNLSSRPPAVTLITLQEAQARERFRSNTVHTTATRSKQPFPSSEDIPEATEEPTVEMDTGGKAGHTRARSISAGARDNAIPLLPVQPPNTEMEDESPISTPVSAAHGRTLRHKKSGFLRLFGGRHPEPEKERCPPPPIPPLADVYADEKASKLSKASKSSLSPTLRSDASNATSALTHSAASGGDGPDSKGPSPRRRQPPPLSIVTKASDHIIATSVSAGPPMGLNYASPSFSLTVPQSAPPGNSDFHGLTLRPVSTSFSSHFADMVASTAEAQHDVHSPSSVASSSAALSPFTPVSTRRSDDASATAGEASGEEYLTIKGLQDQLVSAKKAWEQQIWELRGHIRDLTSELEDLRAADNQEYCEVCGRGESGERYGSSDGPQLRKAGVVNRPRVRTGDTARFASGN